MLSKKFFALIGVLLAVASLTGQANNAAPVAKAGGPYSGTTGVAVTLDGSASTGKITGYCWNFGDGTAACSASIASHVYWQAGLYTVTLTVTDQKRRTSVATAIASITSPTIPDPVPPPPPAEICGDGIDNNGDGQIDEGCAISSNGTLLQSTDVVPLGTFRLPTLYDPLDRATFAYGGTALSFDARTGGLFMVGHTWNQWVAEISIPQIGGTASLIQDFADPTEGELSSINPSDPNAKIIGGTLPWGDKLIVAAYSYYDGAGTQVLSHFVRPFTLAPSGSVVGPLQVGPLGAGFYSAYMAPIPLEWRASLGGTALTGNGSIAIVSRTSYGPAVFAFDPDHISSTGALPLVYYPSDHQTLGPWEGSSQYWGGSDEVKAVVFPDGTSSVLFLGRHGSRFCYGAGTSDPSLDGQFVPGEVGVVYCYDPTDSSKGVHGYPYHIQVWAYDANEFVSVRSGVKAPWDVLPYAMWTLDDIPQVRIGGAAYDPIAKRLYVSALMADGDNPLVHVYAIK